jgi:hypothetical protein
MGYVIDHPGREKWAERPISFPVRRAYFLRGMSEPPSSDPLTWFSEDELDICPHCGKRAVPHTDDKAAVCLNCEVAWIRDIPTASAR